MNTPQGSNNFTTERKDVLLGLYQENCTHMRHYESQRATATNIMIVASLGLASVMATDHKLTRADWPLTSALIIIGLFGTLFTAIHFERIRFYERRAMKYYDELDALIFKEQSLKSLKEILNAADRERGDNMLQTLRWLNNTRSFRIFWPLTIAVFGIILTVLALGND